MLDDLNNRIGSGTPPPHVGVDTGEWAELQERYEANETVNKDNEITAIATPSGSLSVDVNPAGNYLAMPMRATTGPWAGDIREATLIYDAWHNPIEVQDVLHNDVHYIYDTRGRLLTYFETNSPTTNPFGSRQPTGQARCHGLTYTSAQPAHREERIMQQLVRLTAKPEGRCYPPAFGHVEFPDGGY